MSGLAFSTLISSSSGNCTVVGSPGGAVVFDAGFSSQRRFRDALNYIRENFGPVRGVVISHAHRDHVNYHSLRVMSSMAVPLFLSIETADRIARSEKCAKALSDCHVELFEDIPFKVSDLSVESFPVEHTPKAPNRGFVIGGEGVKIGFATDLKHARGLAPRLADCDMLYLESNHDSGLLRLHPNPNSWNHLKNEKASDFVTGLVASGSGPRMVMFGHLSTERNTPEHVRREYEKRMHGRENAPQMQIAPPFSPSMIVNVGRTAGSDVISPPATESLFGSTPSK
ncbi:MAG: MBL fold metallo-hydrolase [Planctomycetota bacterium]|nr:MBL fold metallo-hydrolase [Planctomycetota bacterium]